VCFQYAWVTSQFPVQTNLVWKTRELGGYGVSGRSQQQIRYKFEPTQYKKYHPQRGDGLARISPAVVRSVQFSSGQKKGVAFFGPA